MRDLVEELCSEKCAGRAPGTPGGLLARAIVVERLRRAGLDPVEQPAPGCKGANVIAKLPGARDRWVVVGAHYDHLGQSGRRIFHGADDNAAAVAILLDAAAALAARRPEGRGVIIAAFDGEEPPYFLSGEMGSQEFVRRPPVPLESIDFMICMDLVGHAMGPAEMPAGVRQSVFALGAERSEGTAARVDRLARAVPGVVIRRVDAEIIPPLSDYYAFWEKGLPFLFLTNGRWRHYHTPEDTPEKLDYAKMAATARWLEAFVRDSCARPEAAIRGLPDACDDAATLRSIIDVTSQLARSSDEAATGTQMAQALLGFCDERGAIAPERKDEVRALVGMLEARLA